jgi:VanZ family protein
MSEGGDGRRRWLLWLPPLAVMAGIFALSSISGLKVSEDADIDRPFRISGHLIAYALLAGTVLVALTGGRRPRPRDIAIALVVATLYGLSDEWHQSLVPDRVGRLQDVGMDVVGAIVGLVVATLLLTVSARLRGIGGAKPRAP